MERYDEETVVYINLCVDWLTDRQLEEISLLWGEDESDDKSVKTQNFGENEDKNHTDK